MDVAWLTPGKRYALSGAVAVVLWAAPGANVLSEDQYRVLLYAGIAVIGLLIGPPILARYRPKVEVTRPRVKITAPEAWRRRRSGSQAGEDAAVPPRERVSLSPEALAPVDVDDDEPTFKGQARMIHVLGEYKKAVDQAKQYRERDPETPEIWSYKCPFCNYRSYTDRGALSMLTHIERKHNDDENENVEPELGPLDNPYPPRLRQVPAERFEIELAAYCNVRLSAQETLKNSRADLILLPPDAGKVTESEWAKRMHHCYVKFQQAQADWPQADRKLETPSEPVFRPYWAAKHVAAIDVRLAWLASHGAQCDT